MSAWPCIVEDT